MNKPSLPRGKVKRKIKRKKTRRSYILPIPRLDTSNNMPLSHKKKCVATRFQRVSPWHKDFSNLNWDRACLLKNQTIILESNASAIGRERRYIMTTTLWGSVFGRIKIPKSPIVTIRCFWLNGSDMRVCFDSKKPGTFNCAKISKITSLRFTSDSYRRFLMHSFIKRSLVGLAYA